MENKNFWICLVWVVSSLSAYAQGKNFTETVNGVMFEMVYVEGGTFMMGATEEQGSDADSDEYPVHEVTLSDYYIGKYEVTERLWVAVMGYGDQIDYPTTLFSWNSTQEFVAKLRQLTGKNYVLPTEAQWEYAARGGNGNKKITRVWCGDGEVVFSSIISSGTKYSGSDNFDEVAWYTGNSGIWEAYGRATHPVGTKQPNALGLYDMSGNVWEWCQDWYGSYSSAAQVDPTGPSSGSLRVLRGGSWISFAGDCRVSNRSDYFPRDPFHNSGIVGFRVVLLP